MTNDMSFYLNKGTDLLLEPVGGHLFPASFFGN